MQARLAIAAAVLVAATAAAQTPKDELEQQLKDMVGNPMLKDFEWSFQTSAQAGPPEPPSSPAPGGPQPPNPAPEPPEPIFPSSILITEGSQRSVPVDPPSDED